MFLTRPARSCAKNFCGLVAPCGRSFVFTPLKRSAGTCFSTARLPSLLRSSFERCTVEKHSKPGGDAKSPWTARSIPQSPLSSRISPCASPASLLLHRKILFAQNLGIVPTTDSFTHPLPMLHKADSPYFSSARSPERIHLLWHTWTSPVQNRDKNVGHHTPTSLYSALPCSSVAPRHKLPSF